MNNKKITKMLKKTATVAMLTFATAAPLTMTAQHASAATYTASKYFPGETADTDNEYSNKTEGDYFRNFKHRSANLYVKDEKLKKIYQKAAKVWAPVFKFNFVNSPKHANFNSAKYANVIVKKDGGSKDNYATVNKVHLVAGSMRNLKQMHKDFPNTRNQSWYGLYVDGRITNYKKWKSYYKNLLAGNKKAIDIYNGTISTSVQYYAPKAGMWMPSDSNAKRNSWNHYITIGAGTRGLSQKQQIKNATATLGEVIGLSAGNYNQGSQSDLDYVDWIYAHPWSGSNVYWDTRSLLS